jgi:hypothetical protein
MTNVARDIRNRMRRNTPKSIEDIEKRREHREMVKARRHDRSYDKLREKYEWEDACYDRAVELYSRFGPAGVTWAACMQAVKTDTVSTFTQKYGSRVRDQRSEEQGQYKDS